MKLEEKLSGCKEIEDETERAKCLWDVVYRAERFIDEVRKDMPRRNDLEVLASISVERCVDISREIAKGMREDDPKLIDFGYIKEKKEKLNHDLKSLEEEVKKA